MTATSYALLCASRISSASISSTLRRSASIRPPSVQIGRQERADLVQAEAGGLGGGDQFQYRYRLLRIGAITVRAAIDRLEQAGALIEERELIPLMHAQGRDLEEAATSLGASGWRTFFSVTVPNVKWALLYGVVLCKARVMGEFGAVSVVSGNIRGPTNTLPLHIELLYHDYQTAGDFASASILALIAVFTIFAKVALERQGAGRIRPAAEPAGKAS